MRHHQTSTQDAAYEQVLTTAQSALYQWLHELAEGWVELQPPTKLRAEPENALVTVAEYYDAMGDRYGMEKAYDTERHRALHFEQATELKDHHIENLETELRHLRRRAEKQESRVADVEAEVQELAGANEALRAELRELHENSRAAASNLVAVAKRGLSGRGPGRA
jgi:chromosome segregation ATPase